MSRNYRNGSVILDIDETKELKVNINVKVTGIKLKYCFRRQNPKSTPSYYSFFSRWSFGIVLWEITTFGKTVNIFMYVEMIKVQLNLLLEIFKGS